MTATERLREAADAIGLTWTAGYQLEGRCTDTATVTTLWPVPGDASQSLTFEEWDGRLVTDDELSVAQALGAARRSRHTPRCEQSGLIAHGGRLRGFCGHYSAPQGHPMRKETDT